MYHEQGLSLAKLALLLEGSQQSFAAFPVGHLEVNGLHSFSSLETDPCLFLFPYAIYIYTSFRTSEYPFNILMDICTSMQVLLISIVRSLAFCLCFHVEAS